MIMRIIKAGVLVCAAVVLLGPLNSPAIAGDEVSELKEQVSAQQKEIQDLRTALEAQRKLLERILPAVEAVAARQDELSKASGQSGSATLGGVAVASVAPVLPRGTNALAAVGGPVPPASAGASPQEGAGPELDLVKGKLDAVAESGAQTNLRVSKLEADIKDAEKKNTARVRGLGNFNFSGDVRFRYEPFFQEHAVTRQRERVRARLNIIGKISDEISGGVSVATGTLDDVNSTNQSLTGFFTRKSIGFDKYYLTYKPKWAKPLTLQAGKMTYPWFRTPLTFDNDVNPEGLSQALSFDVKGGPLTNITLVGFQLPFNEVSAGYDSFVFGGQLQTKFKFTDRSGLALYASGVNFNRADPIAVAIGAGTLRPSLSNSNTFRTNASGTVIGYASKFAYLDLIAVYDNKLTPRWPMAITLNFTNNTRAHSQERSAYMADITFGQLKEKKDISFGYSYWWLEKDSVIAAFNESDLRLGTNVKNHRTLLGYQAFNNVTVQWTMWLGKLDDPFLNTSAVPSPIRSNCTSAPFTDCHDTLLNRMQFDFIYKF